VRRQRDIFSSLAISPRAPAAQKFGALLPGVEHRSVRLRLGKPLNVELAFGVVSGLFLDPWTKCHLPKIF
jgi:hypothetical protein